MPSRSFLPGIIAVLNSSSVLRSFPLSLLLIVLEVLIDQDFSCPCRRVWTESLITLICYIPAFFAFVLAFFFLRPFCGSNAQNQADQQNVNMKRYNCEKWLNCLIPPAVWIIIFLLDGDYMACFLTKTEGNYAFSEELNRNWCQPTVMSTVWIQSEKESDLRTYQNYIYSSRISGYVVAFIVSFLAFVVSFSGYCDEHLDNKPEVLTVQLAPAEPAVFRVQQVHAEHAVPLQSTEPSVRSTDIELQNLN